MKAYPKQEEELKIFSIQKKSDSYKKLKVDDIIYSINSEIVKTREDFDNEIKKILWGDEVKVGVIRKNKRFIIKIKTTSLYNYRLRTIELGIGFKKSKDKFLKSISEEDV